MSLGLSHARRRQRRQRRITMLKWMVVLTVLVAAGAYAYNTGSTLARQEVIRLSEEIDSLKTTIDDMAAQNAQLAAETEKARLREQQWQARYKEEVPTGKPRELLALVERRLSEGVPADRLAFVIGAAKSERVCDEKPVSKRFVVPTPIYRGPSDSVSFADGAITVTAQGQSALNDAGNPEAWYDPAQPITLRFTELGGESSQVTGVLPLHHSVVIGNDEYRFTIVAGQRSFVNVTGDRCDYP